MDILSIVTQTTTPIILISAIGLLTLAFQNRYGRVKDSVYAFQKQKIIYTNNKEEEKAARAKKMLSFYQKEAKLIKNTMLCSFISILFISFTSFSIMLDDIIPLNMEIVTLVLFALAIVSLVIAIILKVISLTRSIRTMNHEVETDNDGIRFGL